MVPMNIHRSTVGETSIFGRLLTMSESTLSLHYSLSPNSGSKAHRCGKPVRSHMIVPQPFVG